MILTRLGNKRQLAQTIYRHFPNHRMRIDLFFGAGGLFFYSPKAAFNILNDLDDDVTNLFLILKERKEDLYQALELLPISSSLVQHWKKQQETDPLQKAIRFLFLSNFTYLGKGDTLRLGLDNTKARLLTRIEPTFEALKNTKITNYDFREVLGKISFSRTVLDKEKAFVYLDPVYLETEHCYKVPNWTQKESLDCFDIMSHSGIKCAMSEFDHPFILAEAKRRGFNIIPIRERQNIKNRKMELLITNYQPIQRTLF
ncbi:DNA adenine methylase [Aureispira anguillae]|uniref:DNA adenine methylase n=1 Tax=Aureispira anguillae TaxID=2864201 RepID=A0A915YFS3_9BACT|nr:DNA adenine methylase [Aureispira anguillae]BDS10592.1 DNA adenine methylase [Aureispira anguillae]BDS10847.1 DNA adenine methylase [Aureispira anguillae]BDS12329.1 DNA adenine methylase [Aureispira anguillae]